MPDLVLDTDVASLMWRNAIPWQLDRQLIGLTLGVTFVTLGEAFAGAYSAHWKHRAACCVSHGLPLLTRNCKHFEPLEPLGLVLR